MRAGRSPRRVPSLLAGARFATWPQQAAWLHRVRRGIDDLPVVVSGRRAVRRLGCVAVWAGVRGNGFGIGSWHAQGTPRAAKWG